MDFERIRFLKRLDKLEEEVSLLQARLSVLETPTPITWTYTGENPYSQEVVVAPTLVQVKPPPKRRGRPPKVKDGH